MVAGLRAGCQPLGVGARDGHQSGVTQSSLFHDGKAWGIRSVLYQALAMLGPLVLTVILHSSSVSGIWRTQASLLSPLDPFPVLLIGLLPCATGTSFLKHKSEDGYRKWPMSLIEPEALPSEGLSFAPELPPSPAPARGPCSAAGQFPARGRGSRTLAVGEEWPVRKGDRSCRPFFSTFVSEGEQENQDGS